MGRYSCERHQGKWLDRTKTCTCVIDGCKDCGGRHVGALPEFHPCAKCGAGIRYPQHHVCIDRLPEVEAEHKAKTLAILAAGRRTVVDVVAPFDEF